MGKRITDETPDENQPKNCRTIYVRAEGVVAFGNGLFGIEVPVRQLEKDEYEILHKLFPHTYEKMEDALATEALIGAQDQPLSTFDDKPVVRIDRHGNQNAARY